MRQLPTMVFCFGCEFHSPCSGFIQKNYDSFLATGVKTGRKVTADPPLCAVIKSRGACSKCEEH